MDGCELHFAPPFRKMMNPLVNTKNRSGFNHGYQVVRNGFRNHPQYHFCGFRTWCTGPAVHGARWMHRWPSSRRSSRRATSTIRTLCRSHAPAGFLVQNPSHVGVFGAPIVGPILVVGLNRMFTLRFGSTTHGPRPWRARREEPL